MALDDMEKALNRIDAFGTFEILDGGPSSVAAVKHTEEGIA